jgi:hypothetical protein
MLAFVQTRVETAVAFIDEASIDTFHIWATIFQCKEYSVSCSAALLLRYSTTHKKVRGASLSLSLVLLTFKALVE